jgi:hypothetical protein
MDSEEKPDSRPGGVDRESDAGGCVPLSVREGRRARKMREDAWPYVWMNFVSIILLTAALGTMAKTLNRADVRAATFRRTYRSYSSLAAVRRATPSHFPSVAHLANYLKSRIDSTRRIHGLTIGNQA